MSRYSKLYVWAMVCMFLSVGFLIGGNVPLYAAFLFLGAAFSTWGLRVESRQIRS